LENKRSEKKEIWEANGSEKSYFYYASKRNEKLKAKEVKTSELISSFFSLEHV
jgi:hypothetical protein